jgi:hypothetical protein
LYTVGFNVIIMEPVKAGVKSAVYPIVANYGLNINWDKYMLSGDDYDVLQELDDWDDDDDDDDEVPPSFVGGSGSGVAALMMMKNSNKKASMKQTVPSPTSAFTPIKTNVGGQGPGVGDSNSEMKSDEVSPSSNASVSPSPSSSASTRSKLNKQKKRRRTSNVRRSSARSSFDSIDTIDMDDPDPMWECACGHTCRESIRQVHLGDCRLFKRSWKAAFHALTRSLFNQRQLGMTTVGTVVGETPPPPTLEQRIALLEKAVAFYDAKKAAVSDDCNEKSAEDKMTSSIRIDRWWNRGMLLAALIESGGDVKKAGKKLCSGSSGKKKGNLKAAISYRAEMNFVAQKVGLETLLAEHNRQRQLAEM